MWTNVKFHFLFFFNKSMKSSMLLSNACWSFIHFWCLLFSVQEYTISLKVKRICFLVFATANTALKLRSQIEYPWSSGNFWFRWNWDFTLDVTGKNASVIKNVFSRELKIEHENNYLLDQSTEHERSVHGHLVRYTY